MFDLFREESQARKKELRPHQVRAIDMVRQSLGTGNRRVVMQGATGFGKCLGLGTPIVLASGEIVPVQDVIVGDRLASPSGEPVTVLSQARGREQMFRITPTKGDSWVCNASHLLSLRTTGSGCRTHFADGQAATGEKGEVITIRADKLHASSRTARHISKQWRPSAVEFDMQGEITIPPYALGVWLGDGSSKHPDVTKPHGVVVDAWLELAERLGCNVRVSHGSTGCPTFHVSTPRGKVNPLREMIRDLGLIGNKHIPPAYKTASVADRLRLLAGIFDTDGSTDKGGIDYISKSEMLARDVAFVCRSVGLAAYVKPCRKGIKATGFVGNYWRVLVSGDCSRLPTRRLRIAPRTQVKDHLVTGFTIEPIGEGDYYGFEVTGDRLFLLGDFTVTHNTLVASKIIERARERGNRVIFTAPAISLIDQTVTAFEREGLTGIGVMQANHPRTDRLAPIQIASVQTLAKREIPDASLVIVDECHLRAKVIDAMMDERQDLYFVGMSATPWAKGMGLRWQDIVIPVTIGELIADGYLSQYTAYAPSVPNLSGVKVRAGEYVESQLQELMGDAKLVGHVVQNWLERGQDRPTLCFGVNCAHAKEMAVAFERQGVAVAYVDGFTDMVERNFINRRFRAGEIRVICSVRTMTTGVDLPVSCIIDAAPTMSEMLHIQKIGRGLRVNPGTEDLVIFDHAGNLLRLGMPDEIGYDELDKSAPGEPRKAAPKAERLPTECGKCSTMYSGLICPCCGNERKPVSKVEAADGDLVQVTGKVVRASKEDKQRFYSMSLWLAGERGYKPGWAANLYRKKMGVWPRGLAETSVPADAAFLNFEKSQRIAWAKRMEKQRDDAGNAK